MRNCVCMGKVHMMRRCDSSNLLDVMPKFGWYGRRAIGLNQKAADCVEVANEGDTIQ